jgi:hypothetical protein
VVGPQWPIAVFNDVLDLGVGRRVNCAPRKNGATVCWATTHRLGTIGQDVPRSLSLIIMEDDKAFFGSWELLGELPRESAFFWEWNGSPSDIEHSFADNAVLSAGAELDRQGRKGVPHACLSCHGGYYNPVTHEVTGASLLPVVPGRVGFNAYCSSPFGSEEPCQYLLDYYKVPAQEPIRRINEIILQSNPAPAIVDQINAMYNGAPNTPGTVANDTAVPSGWRQQPGLYQKVIEPYCASCHFAQRGPMNFRSWGNLLQNKDAVQRTMCTDFTMPHSQILFRKFWTANNGVLAPNLLSTALGFQQCR